jgi:hypothetical protein
MSEFRDIRVGFYRGLLGALRVVWPILSVLLGAMAGLGLLIGHLEDWRLQDGIYFAFVTGLTVGYGDLVPTGALSRILAIGIGFMGILVTALLAAVSVRALEYALGKGRVRESAEGDGK